MGQSTSTTQPGVRSLEERRYHAAATLFEPFPDQGGRGIAQRIQIWRFVRKSVYFCDQGCVVRQRGWFGDQMGEPGEGAGGLGVALAPRNRQSSGPGTERHRRAVDCCDPRRADLLDRQAAL